MRRLVYALLVSAAATALADAPTFVITHQGRLLAGDDTPVNSETDLTITIWDSAEGGSQKWTKTFPATQVRNGFYALNLGEDGSLKQADIAGARWISVSVGSTALTPRQRIGVAPLAVRAEIAARAEKADDADKLGGAAAGDYALKTYVDAAVAAAAPQGFARLDGATFTGAVTLAGEPTADGQAATKKYVDGAVAGAYTKGEADQKFVTQELANGESGFALKSALGTSITSALTPYAKTADLEVYAKKSDVGGSGENLLVNGDLQKGAEGYALTQATLVDVNDGVAGLKAFQNNANAIGRVDSTRRVLLDRSRTYHAEAFFRLNNSGTAGKVGFVVRLFDAAGTEITGTGGAPWYVAHAAYDVGSAWQRLWANFGAGTAQALPAAARFASVGAVLNLDNTVNGNRLHQVQGFSLSASDGAPWILASREDFDSANPSGWTFNGSGSNPVYDCNGSKLLGGYGNWAAGTASKTYDLSKFPHSEVQVRLTYYALDTWDGEVAFVNINGARYFRQVMSNCSWTGGSICGYEGNNAAATCGSDYVQPIQAQFRHTGNTLVISAGSTLDQGATDESFGLDDIEIWVR